MQWVTWRVVGAVVGAVLWEVYARTEQSLLIPPFSTTVVTVVKIFPSSELWHALWVSNQALLLGFAIAVAIGLPVGVFLGRSRWARRIGNPYVGILLVSPTAMFIPLLIMWTGVGLTSRVILVVLMSVAYLVVNTRAGVREVDPQLIEMARSYQASEFKLWTRILVPGALPQIMTGLRLTLGRAIDGMVVVELIMVAVGVGRLILVNQAVFEPERLYAVVVYVLIEAVILSYLARWVERRVTPWMQKSSGR